MSTVPAVRAGEGARPLRRDAQRNRERILTAAAELFASEGLTATMDDIAAAAGIGVGTVYRRFPDKRQLVDALFETRVDRMAALARQATEDPDPWNGLVDFMERSLAIEAADRGLAELLRSGVGGSDRIARARACIAPLAESLLRRAQEAGQVRPDLVVGDLLVGKMMLLTVAHHTPATPELWRRYFLLFVESLRARPGEGAAPLPTPPVDVGPLRTAVRSLARQYR
jgi:AcrR family transcriptional regulator